MGCTSSKPKRTTSIEDVGASKQPQNAAPVPDKNGQVNKTPNEKILREKDPSKTETNAMEIPGAHKSFMAPDGIPFIDEDVESETDEGPAAPVSASPGGANDSRHSAASAKQFGSPDQNKNVTIVVNKETVKTTSSSSPAVHAVAPVAAATAAASERSSALRETGPGGDGDHRVVVVSTGHHQVSAETPAAPAVKESVVISEIKRTEIEITTNKNQQNESTEVRSRTVLIDSDGSEKHKTDEELAATKIQAGIRGYLDRQKVKAIRANKQQHPTDAPPSPHVLNGVDTQEPKVTYVELHSDDLLHDPKLDKAATKIQANYKGYRTRKELKLQK